MIKQTLNEDIKPSKIPVKFSIKISKRIENIYECNRVNENISKWLDYIEWVRNYISNRSIAWDYANQHIKFPNGTRFISKFNVGYSVKCDGQGVYVYVFMMDLKTDDFGLKLPKSLKENNIIDCNIYYDLLLENYYDYLHDFIYWGK